MTLYHTFEIKVYSLGFLGKVNVVAVAQAITHKSQIICAMPNMAESLLCSAKTQSLLNGVSSPSNPYGDPNYLRHQVNKECPFYTISNRQIHSIFQKYSRRFMLGTQITKRNALLTRLATGTIKSLFKTVYIDIDNMHSTSVK